MRCDNCPYLNVSSWDSCDTFCDIFGYDDSMLSEDRNGNFGCKYNKRTLEKMLRDRDKEIEEWLDKSQNSTKIEHEEDND